MLFCFQKTQSALGYFGSFWHIKSFHFETPKQEPLNCEANKKNMVGETHELVCYVLKDDLGEVEGMPNFKNLVGEQNFKFSKLLFMGVGAFMHVIRKGMHFLFMHFLQQMLRHNNMKSFSIQMLQGCVWKENCWHL